MQEELAARITVDGILGSGYPVQTIQNNPEMSSQRGGRNESILGIGWFVFFVFACIALTHSNNQLVSNACGDSLRNIVMADMVLQIFSPCIFIPLLMWMFYKRTDNTKILLSQIFIILLFLALAACLGGFTISETVTALNNSNCTAVLSSTDGGINSPSANLGSPLLAIAGIIYGALFLIWALGLLVILVMLSVFGCMLAHH
jgi:hypothetical protein